jgi:DNA helicase HerA-like ATPase
MSMLPLEADGPSHDDGRIGLVDGSVESDSRTFHVVLDPEVVIQLDELIAVTTDLPGDRQVTHYGIVTELRSRFEGADLPSDTGRVVDRTLPAEHVRRAEVRVLRVVPELFVSPHAGAMAARAVAEHRTAALFEDEMTRGKLPVGLDLGGAPVYADMRFVDGRSGGHVSISGISGVATKTSYALFLLYQLLETDGGMELLGGRAMRENVRALVFNTKGEDLLHLDRPNREFADKPEQHEQWRALGVLEPGPFRSVRLYAPRGAGAEGNLTPLVQSRATGDIDPYGWTPEQFIRDQLLQFCFTSEDERATQVGFVEQQVRIQLLRRLRRPAGDDSGAVVIADQVAPNTGYNPDRLADREPDETPIGAGHMIREFGDLIDLLEEIAAEDNEPRLNEWFGRTQGGTRQAFLRRLLRLRRHLGPLIGCGLAPLSLENARLHVVDISRLHDDAQRFVVGALLDRIWSEKQGSGRLPLRFVVLDELNKYAPAQGFSPLKELLIDIAERGRSLGVLLIGAQQAASAVAQALPRNASLKVAGRLDASESDTYRFLTPALRDRATRFMPGTMVASQPIVPEPIPIRFPFPPFATNPDEAAPDTAAQQQQVRQIEQNLAALDGPRFEL